MATLLLMLISFMALEDFPKTQCAFTTIWTSVLFVIWKDCNRRIFHNKSDHLETLAEKVKLQTYW